MQIPNVSYFLTCLYLIFFLEVYHDFYLISPGIFDAFKLL